MSETTTVYDAAAGHSALTIQATPANVQTVEMDPVRAEALERMGFNPIRADATVYNADRVDIVVTNPPFGPHRATPQSQPTVFAIGQFVPALAEAPNLTTKYIDHAIAFQALEAMKPGGRAVLILQGPGHAGTAGEFLTRLLVSCPRLF